MTQVPPPRDCILFSTADWSAPYWTNKQHIARLLARRGWRVLYVESPGIRGPKLRAGRDWARIARRLGEGLSGWLGAIPNPEPGIFVLSPLVIPGAGGTRIGRTTNRISFGPALRRLVRKLDFREPVIWTYHPFIFEALQGLPRGKLIYHCFDDVAALPFVDGPTYKEAERKLARRADIIFTTHKGLTQRLSADNPNTHYFPNVADEVHFGRAFSAPEPTDLADIPHPRLGYHGVLSDFKVDFRLLSEVFRTHPAWQLVLIGEEREGQHSPDLAALSALPNVHRLGYRPYELLPAYLGAFDAGLLPSVLNAYTRSMFPMKFYEYLAAGLRVVSTPLPFASERHVGVEIGEDAVGFAAAISRALAVGRMSQAEARAAVGENTWELRLDKMLAVAGLDVSSER